MKAGFAFARVDVIPDLDTDNKTVGLNIKISPGQRVYVRRIVFSGQNRTHDDVLRREMRQMEGSRFSPRALSRSQTRLQRLPYIERVSINTPRVPGSDDLVDIAVSVSEGPSGSFGAGAGYGTDGFIFNINFTQENLFGTGERFALAFDNSTSQDNFSVSYTDPYYTPDGISRNIRGFIKKTDTSQLTSTANFILDSYGVKVRYGVPLSEFPPLVLVLAMKRSRLLKHLSPPLRYAISLMNSAVNTTCLMSVWVIPMTPAIAPVFATSGMRNSLSLEVTSPNSDLSYVKVGYNFEYFRPITDRYTLAFSSRINYGKEKRG